MSHKPCCQQMNQLSLVHASTDDGWIQLIEIRLSFFLSQHALKKNQNNRAMVAQVVCNRWNYKQFDNFIKKITTFLLTKGIKPTHWSVTMGQQSTLFAHSEILKQQTVLNKVIRYIHPSLGYTFHCFYFIFHLSEVG